MSGPARIARGAAVEAVLLSGERLQLHAGQREPGAGERAEGAGAELADAGPSRIRQLPARLHGGVRRSLDAQQAQAALHLAAHVLHADHFLSEVTALGPVHGATLQRGFMGPVPLVVVGAELRQAALEPQLEPVSFAEQLALAGV